MPRVTFDLVTADPVHGEAVVYLVEEGPWPENEAGWNARLRGLQDRLYDAVDAVVDGHLAGRFPDLHGKPVRIQIDSPSGCPRDCRRSYEGSVKHSLRRASIAKP